MQHIVDAYWKQIVAVCGAHPECFTDGGAEQAFVVDRDLAPDGNHLSIAGHRGYAESAWPLSPRRSSSGPDAPCLR